MFTVKSGFVMRIKKSGWLLPAIFLSGCSLPPAIPVIGAYYPGWLFCIIAGVVLTAATRLIILRRMRGAQPGMPALLYTALFALYAMLFWLLFF